MTDVREMKDSEVDLAAVRDLFWEYLQWANERGNSELGVDFDIASMLEEDMKTLEKFSPPQGRIFLAIDDGRPVGLGCLKRLAPDIGEIKRMYVRPEARGSGLGRALLESLTAHAKAAGYSRIRLDSAGFMKTAHALYRSAGFRDIDPYPESEIPPDFQQHWVFMEKAL